MRQATHAFTTTEPAAERQRLHTLRTQIESTLEDMIALLDSLDGDPDLEGQPAYTPDGLSAMCADPDLEPDSDAEPDDDDEPSLGSLDRQPQDRSWRVSGGADLEGDGDGREADLEPSLGSLGGCVASERWSQRCWAGGETNDAEADVCDEPHDDNAGPGGQDSEPSLGATEAMNQNTAWRVMAGTRCGSYPLGEDEPTLGAADTGDGTNHLAGWDGRTLPRLDDVEEDHEREPSLGAPEPVLSMYSYLTRSGAEFVNGPTYLPPDVAPPPQGDEVGRNTLVITDPDGARYRLEPVR